MLSVVRGITLEKTSLRGGCEQSILRLVAAGADGVLPDRHHARNRRIISGVSQLQDNTKHCTLKMCMT